MQNHLLYGRTVIGMLVSAAKDRIDNETAPVHLKRLKAFFLLIGRLDTMAMKGVVIVHDHRIDAQLDHSRLGNLQTPDKKGLQDASEQKNPRPRKGLKKTLDLMRGGHVGFVRLNAAGITFILAKLIKVGQPATRT